MNNSARTLSASATSSTTGPCSFNGSGSLTEAGSPPEEVLLSSLVGLSSDFSVGLSEFLTEVGSSLEEIGVSEPSEGLLALARSSMLTTFAAAAATVLTSLSSGGCFASSSRIPWLFAGSIGSAAKTSRPGSGCPAKITEDSLAGGFPPAGGASSTTMAALPPPPTTEATPAFVAAGPLLE